MCEKIIERLPSMTAEERLQLRRNCERAACRSDDGLVVQEAKRILDELQILERREADFLARQPAARRIEYAFRRLPASEGERMTIRLLHEHANTEKDVRSAGTAVGTTALRNWHHVLEMCRRRRHLLQPCEDRRESTPEDADWALPLLESGNSHSSVRLRPEAVAAFASLGYVSSRR